MRNCSPSSRAWRARPNSQPPSTEKTQTYTIPSQSLTSQACSAVQTKSHLIKFIPHGTRDYIRRIGPPITQPHRPIPSSPSRPPPRDNRQMQDHFDCTEVCLILRPNKPLSMKQETGISERLQVVASLTPNCPQAEGSHSRSLHFMLNFTTHPRQNSYCVHHPITTKEVSKHL